VPGDSTTSEQDPAQGSEREAIQREARQVGRTYRGMGRLNGIADTPHDAREQWRERITALQDRRDRYVEKWGVKLPNERIFKVTGGVGQPWLQEMVDAVDAIVWQLDNEYEASTGG
jgi:hypothetical protein